jgi:hypothetical protein
LAGAAEEPTAGAAAAADALATKLAAGRAAAGADADAGAEAVEEEPPEAPALLPEDADADVAAEAETVLAAAAEGCGGCCADFGEGAAGAEFLESDDFAASSFGFASLAAASAFASAFVAAFASALGFEARTVVCVVILGLGARAGGASSAGSDCLRGLLAELAPAAPAGAGDESRIDLGTCKMVTGRLSTKAHEVRHTGGTLGSKRERALTTPRPRTGSAWSTRAWPGQLQPQSAADPMTGTQSQERERRPPA